MSPDRPVPPHRRLPVDGPPIADAGPTASAIGGPSTGISVSKVTVVDVTKPAVTTNSIPGMLPGEVALFAPGMATFQRALDLYSSEISIANSSAARSLRDLRLYFTP